MAEIHLIDGEKGGVGKSFFCRVLIEYLQKNQIDFSLFDADRTNPDVGLIYEPHIYNQIDNNQAVFFSESEKKAYLADAIFEKALSMPVVVNLPAQVYHLVSNWLSQNDLLGLAKKSGISFYKWFLCTGGYDSLELFKKSLEDFGEDISHILIKNSGFSDSWSHLKDDENLSNYLEKYQVQQIELPKLSYRERNLIDAQKWTFTAASTSNELGLMARNRVRLFLDKANSQIDSLKIFLEKVDETNNLKIS